MMTLAAPRTSPIAPDILPPSSWQMAKEVQMTDNQRKIHRKNENPRVRGAARKYQQGLPTLRGHTLGVFFVERPI